MGLAHSDKFKVSKHAVKRYRERIDGEAKIGDIDKIVRGLLNKVEFVEDLNGAKEAWVNRKEDIMFIINSETKRIITLYHPSDDYYKKESYSARHLHPVTSSLLKQFIAEATYKEEKKYFGLLAEKYSIYAEKLNSMSRAKRPDIYEVGKTQIEDLRKEITSLEQEKDRVLEELKSLKK